MALDSVNILKSDPARVFLVELDTARIRLDVSGTVS